jgi:hypothetical protein
VRSWLASLVVALVGCAQARSPVHGSYVYRYPDGSTVPVDLSEYTFQAYVSDGTGFTAYPDAPVAGTADGTFEIRDVPDGPILVRRSVPGYFGQFTAYDGHDVRETWDVLGRPDAVPSSSSTRLRLDATGLAAWQPADRLLLDCFGNASEIADPKLTPSLAASATAIHASLAWGNAYSWGPSGGAYLMDPSAGDALLVTHETAHTTGDLTTWTLAQTLAASAPAQVDGESATVTGSFADVEPTARLTATVRGDGLAGTLPPGTLPGELQVSLLVGPGTSHGAQLGPELAAFWTSNATEAATTTLHYGNPFDPSWTPIVTATYAATRPLHVPGRGIDPVSYAAFSETRPLDGDSYLFEPLAPLGPVTIDGASVDDGAVTVPHSQSVLVDFAQPPDGTSGRLIVWEPESQSQVAYIAFDRAPVELPPDIFENGGRYALQIEVTADDGHGRIRSAGTYTDLFTITAQ